MNIIQPIKPENAVEIKEIPDFVIDTFNQLIRKNMSDGRSKVLQKDALELARIKASALHMQVDERRILEERWLDIEGIYRKVGWIVQYDKPTYGENFEAYFLFSKPVVIPHREGV